MLTGVKYIWATSKLKELADTAQVADINSSLSILTSPLIIIFVFQYYIFVN